MLDALEQRIKEKLLDSLIEKMEGSGAERMKPKGIGVEVAAPSKEGLADGLDKAKELLSKGGPLPGIDEKAGNPEEHDDDEQRLMELMGKDDDDEVC